ncbi:uncharacterized protein LAESUDRAFT_745979 [Laetiporus sulphureus 93-53]|uniref:Uncharacterized protein n=1 Tax=Laetiporus sulphureus 93-53 TaxID=1314785 RepID=A0A165B0K8_9APHY|nr:uncharacterized protein LAESUDRAFT_745979 [Laetiporus sulphureus 93-53]KZT00003.1 hypothetical protein LAESUDRAFT_745979 [Laetiporus sulphureus 93-53]
MSAAPTARPAREQPLENRASVLRASILESALELGVGTNCTVTKWIFSPVDEGSEDIDTEPGAGIIPSHESAGKVVGSVGQASSSISRNGSAIAASDATQRIHFDLSATPEPRTISPFPPSPRNGRLRRLWSNGSDSDGGYLSDSGKSKKDKKKDKKAKNKKKDKEDGDGTEYESDGGYFSEASRTQRKKSKGEKKSKAKASATDAPATDYETDGSTGRSRIKKEQRARKGSLAAPTDDSDGGNLSEASTKRKGFFRLNSRSRKKRDAAEGSPSPEVPPVPALPFVSLPIAERFLRTPTPSSTDGSSTASTITSQHLAADHESLMSYTSTEREERAGSMIAREGLTKAFRDAQSVHRPSIDVLATFRNLATVPNSPSPLKTSTSVPSMHPYARAQDTPDSPPQRSLSRRASRSPPLVKGPRPIISPPNTAMLSAKHVPTPLDLHSPTSVRSHIAQRVHTATDGEYILVTPTQNARGGSTSPPFQSPARSASVRSTPSPSHQSASAPTSPPPVQSPLRPHVLAYYGIPPPTPPPQGPLPEPPTSPGSAIPQASRSTSTEPRNGWPSPAGSAPSRGLPVTPSSALKLALSSPNSVPAPPAGKAFVPIISEPVPRAQHGRVSPFPASLAQPKEERGRVSPFPVSPVRSVSPLLFGKKAAVATDLREENAARNPYMNKPTSADGYGPNSGWRDPKMLGAQWQPRSASALDAPRPRALNGGGIQRKVSFEDNASHDDRASERDVDDDLSHYEPADGERVQEEDPEDDQSHYDDSRPPTVYGDGSEVETSSVWSQSESRRSFFDEEKSASARAHFVRQVEAMYGEYTVPPVPALPARN